MDLVTASLAAREAAARIDAKIRGKLRQRARKHGMTHESELAELVEAWKRAARHTKRLHPDERARHKGH
jgi:hypothetical protein